MTILLLLALACGPRGDIDRLDDQLEPVRFSLIDDAGAVLDEERHETATAPVSVDGGAADWTLRTGELTVELHSPTGADLSALDGGELALLTVTDPWSQGIMLGDEEGPVYLGMASYWPGVMDEPMGEGVVDWGQELGTARDESGDRYTWRAVAFATDEGVVELEPGEVDELLIGGVRWRAGVVAAYNKELKQAMDCGPTDIFGFELLRLSDESAAIEPQLVARPVELGPSIPPC